MKVSIPRRHELQGSQSILSSRASVNDRFWRKADTELIAADDRSDSKRTFAPGAPVAKVAVSKGIIAPVRGCLPHASNPARQAAIPAKIAALHKMTFNVAKCVLLSCRKPTSHESVEERPNAWTSLPNLCEPSFFNFCRCVLDFCSQLRGGYFICGTAQIPSVGYHFRGGANCLAHRLL